ncbi:MAG: hypothetical protein ACLRWQ_13015 [Flavonifractor plautii]
MPPTAPPWSAWPWSGAAAAAPCPARCIAARAATGFCCGICAGRCISECPVKFSFASIDKFSTGGIITRLTTDVTNVQMAFMMIIRIGGALPHHADLCTGCSCLYASTPAGADLPGGDPDPGAWACSLS